MPEVSRFYGIVIQMYYADHEPAHFHARYHDDMAVIDIETLQIRKGKLPKRALALVLEWANDHREELQADWQRARSGESLRPIKPLI